MTRKKILLAEDDGDDQQFFHDFLHDRHDLILLSAVANGEELIDYLKRNETNHIAFPDVIILDQNMPMQNGLQTLYILKNTSEFAHITVMVYSTYTDELLIKKSLALGADMVYAKPHDKDGYHKMIDELLTLTK